MVNGTIKVLALTCALVSFLSAAASAQTQWDLPTNYGASAFHTKNIVQFAAEVDKATGGSLKIVVYPGGARIKHAEIKQAVSDGKVAAGEILISLAADEAPVYGVDSIPFLATGYDGARKLYEVQKPYLEKQLAKEGLVLLFSVPWPPQGIYAKREIKSIDDLKGLKFRTYNTMTKRVAELAGAQPTQIEIPDLPAAFASGRVEVMITSASSGVQSKAEEYLTHYIDTQAWLPRNMVFANKAAFDLLSAVEQQALTEAASAAEERGWKLSIEEMTIKTTALKNAGILVLASSEQLKTGLAKIGGAVSREWAASAGADGEAMLAAYRK
jgi:TRAP-type C4-dicarboxylate transport system substrate-binding protein